MKTTTDQDEDGIAERHEQQLVQQRMSAMLLDFIFSQKLSYHTPNKLKQRN